MCDSSTNQCIGVVGAEHFGSNSESLGECRVGVFDRSQPAQSDSQIVGALQRFGMAFRQQRWTCVFPEASPVLAGFVP